MFKKFLYVFLGATLVVAAGASAINVLAARGNAAPVATVTTDLGQGHGSGGVLTLPAGDLSAQEAAALRFMYEEEKLARDVYATLFAWWGQPTFQNISLSEQQHMDSVALLLERYGLSTDVQGLGQFNDPALQSLYNTLTARGQLSLADALKVGAEIEELDILDLQARLSQTDNADIQQVFTSLMNGSYNHLRAFAGALLTQTGETYQPLHLPADLYQSILAGTSGQGYGQSGSTGQANGAGSGQAAASGYGNAGSGTGTGTQTYLTGATTVHGVVAAFDLNVLTLTLDDGRTLTVQLGNSSYLQSLGFAPQIGQSLTVEGFTGDQGLFTATRITVDATGQVYVLRADTAKPAWAGGRGRGGNH